MIIRTPKKTHFTVISNALIEDRRLSWAATGMLIYLLSKPDHWRIQPTQLIKERHLGRDGVYRLLKELELIGYVQKRRVQSPTGRMAGTDWFVFDEPRAVPPRPEKPDTAPPHPDSPYPANPPLVNTEYLEKTDLSQYTHTATPTAAPSPPPCVCMRSAEILEEKKEKPTTAQSDAGKPLTSGEANEQDTPRRSPAETVCLAALSPAALPLAPSVVTVPVADAPDSTLPLAPAVATLPVADAPDSALPLAPAVAAVPVADAPDSACGIPPSLGTSPSPTTPASPAAAPASPAAVDAPASVRPVGMPGARRVASVPPLNADEQAAFDWAAQHPFWRLRITNWVNLRNNFQDGRAFRMQFLDAQHENALADGANTDQGKGYDLIQTPFGGLYHGQNPRAYQSAPPKLCPAERARLAEQRLLDRLDRERAERARVING